MRTYAKSCDPILPRIQGATHNMFVLYFWFLVHKCKQGFVVPRIRGSAGLQFAVIRGIIVCCTRRRRRVTRPTLPNA